MNLDEKPGYQIRRKKSTKKRNGRTPLDGFRCKGRKNSVEGEKSADRRSDRRCSYHLARMNVETKYLRMIQGMKKRGRKDWTVYILRCGDGSLYTGIAKDVSARVKQHSEGRGATYTRTRLPVKLLYQQGGLTHSAALIREAKIKAMSRSRKEEIIFSQQGA